MKSLNKNWLKDKVDDYTIEELERIKSEIINCSNTYKNVIFVVKKTRFLVFFLCFRQFYCII